jgi:hypothetical protein
MTALEYTLWSYCQISYGTAREIKKATGVEAPYTEVRDTLEALASQGLIPAIKVTRRMGQYSLFEKMLKSKAVA